MTSKPGNGTTTRMAGPRGAMADGRAQAMPRRLAPLAKR